MIILHKRTSLQHSLTKRRMEELPSYNFYQIKIHVAGFQRYKNFFELPCLSEEKMMHRPCITLFFAVAKTLHHRGKQLMLSALW